MVSIKPYFIRATYSWIVESQCTPYLLISADAFREDDLLLQFQRDGNIILDVSPSAVEYLNISDQEVSFTASFSGVVRNLFIPLRFIGAIYAAENGRGFFFEDEEEETKSPDFDGFEETAEQNPHQSSDPAVKQKSHLKIIK